MIKLLKKYQYLFFISLVSGMENNLNHQKYFSKKKIRSFSFMFESIKNLLNYIKNKSFIIVNTIKESRKNNNIVNNEDINNKKNLIHVNYLFPLPNLSNKQLSFPYIKKLCSIRALIFFIYTLYNKYFYENKDFISQLEKSISKFLNKKNIKTYIKNNRQDSLKILENNNKKLKNKHLTDKDIIQNIKDENKNENKQLNILNELLWILNNKKTLKKKYKKSFNNNESDLFLIYFELLYFHIVSSYITNGELIETKNKKIIQMFEEILVEIPLIKDLFSKKLNYDIDNLFYINDYFYKKHNYYLSHIGKKIKDNEAKAFQQNQLGIFIHIKPGNAITNEVGHINCAIKEEEKKETEKYLEDLKNMYLSDENKYTSQKLTFI